MASATELALIILAKSYLERPTAMHAVAFGLVATGNAIHFKWHHFSVQHTDNPLQRAHPAQVTRAPTHALGPMETANDGRHSFGNDVGRIAARRFDHGNVEVALLRIGAHFGLTDVTQPRATQEALDRLVRRADLRAFALFLHIRRALCQAIHEHRQASRARGRFQLRPVQPRLAQRLFQCSTEITLSLRLHARGDFL